jgi:cytoskeletal protein CcmA (bactofilin family)
MEMNAPNISFGRIFSLKITIEAGIIIIGDMDVMDETMPAAVCCSATSERTTPI